MDTNTPQRENAEKRGLLSIAVLTLTVLSALFLYKWSGAYRTVAGVEGSGAYQARPDLIPAAGLPFLLACGARTLSYLATVWPALLFGVLIAGLVRAFVSAKDVARLFASRAASTPVRRQLLGGGAGMPLMLCSCCVAPVFSSVRSSGARLSESLAMMLSSPSLNVAALALTFLLFPRPVALTRVGLALFAVLALPRIVERWAATAARSADTKGAADAPGPRGPMEAIRLWAKSSATVAVKSVPVIVLGVFASSLLAASVVRPDFHGLPVNLTVLAVAFCATLIALPTFFEIPLAMTLAASGFPQGAIVAVLFAGPAVNLPSLFTLARVTSRRVALLVFCGVWLAAALAGLSFEL